MQLAMTLGSRGQLHVSVFIYLFQNIIKQIYITLHTFRAYILCKAYDIQSPWKYFPYTLNTYTTSSQDGMVQEGCDCTVSEQVCHLSHCR